MLVIKQNVNVRRKIWVLVVDKCDCKLCNVKKVNISRRNVSVRFVLLIETRNCKITKLWQLDLYCRNKYDCYILLVWKKYGCSTNVVEKIDDCYTLVADKKCVC